MRSKIVTSKWLGENPRNFPDLFSPPGFRIQSSETSMILKDKRRDKNRTHNKKGNRKIGIKGGQKIKRKNVKNRKVGIKGRQERHKR